MSSTLIFVGLPEDSRSSITKTLTSVSGCSQSIADTRLFGTNSFVITSLDYNELGVPNAPKSCIAEIFNADQTDGSPVKNGATKPRVVRDTPTRPRDTHSRLFGQVRQSQAVNNPVSPMVTDTIRSHIQFGDSEMNGSSPTHSPSKMGNGSATSTPSRATYGPPKRNPVTGDGVAVPPQRRRHPAASQREGNPITGDGYKSMNGQINTVTSIHGNSLMSNPSRVPPGGYSSGLW
ncbi:microtubule-associated protein Jupiter isoform X4 [Spodoptera frugiperda]|uniref:Microtubule-associated protein Jupiter isoform X4 n=1 Tax=Spodoptera frugiperda TaxID=7108 RepID=A0A9R0ERH0_SPOFR|nr:microtubule-associated protein Jupiter isoform X4 [Spodoptera frugiperda]